MVRQMPLHRFERFACLAAAILLIAAPTVVTAQITSGTILGTVTDATGGVLPGVAVTIKNAGTGAARTTVTDSQGRYREPQLAIGLYEVTAELQGFQSQVRKNLELTVGSEMVINISLGVGSVSETIMVTTEAPIVQMTSAEVSAVVDAKQLQSLPLNARDIQQLAVLQPGVQMDNYHNFGKNMVVSGTRPEHNRYLLNGVDTTFTFTTAPVSAAGIIMGIDAVQEFKVLTSDYSAAYGEKAGGVVNTITKSGSNQFHGSGYEYLRNSKFDAPNYFDQDNTPPPFRRDQFGASFGGPIVKNKTFFFSNFENFRQRLNMSNLAIVPSALAHQGYLPNATTRALELIGVAPRVAPYMALYPMPNGQTFSDGTGQYFSHPLQKIDEHYVTVRLDQTLSASDSLSGVYTGDWSQELTPTQIDAFADDRTYNKQIASIQNVKMLTQNLVNTTRVGMNKTWYFFRTDTTVPIDKSMYFVPNAFYAPTDEGQFGAVNVTGLKGLGNTSTTTNITPRWFDYWMLSLTSDFNYTRGAHALQFGGSFKRTWDNTVVANPSSRGNYTFLSLRNFMLGAPSTFNVYVPGPAARDPNDVTSYLTRNYRMNIYGFYLQDDIKIGSRMTLNLGARYELQTGPTEVENRITNLDSLTAPAPTVGGQYFQNPHNLISPRVGWVWDVQGDGRTSLRAGGGIFYDEIGPWYYFLQAPGNYPFTRNVTIPNPVFPNAASQIPATSPIDFGAVDPKPSAPRKYAYNVTAQRDLGRRTSLMLAYVGSQSRNLGRSGDQNLYPPTVDANGQLFWPATGLVRPNSVFRSISTIHFDASSSYNSFQVSLNRRIAEGFAFGANYTYATCTDDVSNEFGGGALNGGSSLQYTGDVHSSRGSCSFIANNSANITTTLDLGGHTLTGVAGLLLGNWQWSTITTVQSGVPFEVSLGFGNSRQGALGAGPDRPSWAPGCDASSAVTGNPAQWFNPLCFVPAAPGYLGNVPSRVMRGPGLFTSDWGLVKSFQATGGQRFEFRLEAFNIFNRANFSTPSSTTIFAGNGNNRVASAGNITNTITPSRQIQLGFKFVF